MGFFNGLVGGPDRARPYFPRFDLDWGLGLGETLTTLRQRGVPAVFLCYHGAGDPLQYGLPLRPPGAHGYRLGTPNRPAQYRPRNDV